MAGEQQDPFEQFDAWFKAAADKEPNEPNAVALAAVGADGMPSVRMVLLKGVDERGFVFYTNYESRKGRQLAARPEACLVFLWSPLERQIRIEGKAEKVSAKESDEYFASRPLGARLSARASAQSEVVPERGFLESRMKKEKERHGQHPPRPGHWGGYRVIPERIEFWQGREDRLHDRLLYRRTQGAWTIERLAP